jgi:hypothetical protein
LDCDDGQVTTKVEYEVVYPADQASVMAAFVNEAFLADYAKEVGALKWDVSIEPLEDATRTRLLLTVPTQGMPAMFKRFVPATLDILEVRTWPTTPAGEDIRAQVAVDAAVAKRDAKVRGIAVLAPVENGTSFAMTGDIAVRVPLVGDRAAALVKDLILRVLSKQTIAMNRWIEG